uniref:Uncharacterized protein n=1 Tax=Salvator merianae TaxID=96440 RepID=A0A8D0DNI0_SALMN
MALIPLWGRDTCYLHVRHLLKQSVEKMEAICCDTASGEETAGQSSAQQSCTGECKSVFSTAPQCIPRKKQQCDQEFDLYRSWSSQSLYQNYPDLHIGGDHVADHTCDSGCVMDQTYGDLCVGPVLLSKDIPLGRSPVIEHLQTFKSIKAWYGEDVGERSMALHKEPLSNSMLNNYMETKVEELYKQFLEEKLTRCGSITHLLTSNLSMNNINELNFQLCHEQQTEAPKAKQTLLHPLALFGLQNLSNGSSSEFSTPNLQISGPHGRKKTSAAQCVL